MAEFSTENSYLSTIAWFSRNGPSGQFHNETIAQPLAIIMKYSNFILSIGLLIILFSCGLGESEEEVLINGYYIGWYDTEANRNIYIKDTLNPNFGQVIISGYVYSVGFDNRYILAKSLPSAGNTDFKTYYILDTEGEYNTSDDNNNLQTFFKEDKFNAEIIKRGLDKVEFSKNYTLNPY